MRPSSSPFISGDSLRAIADCVVEEGRAFYPAKVHKGDAVFVQAGRLDDFFVNILPYIRDSFILVTHNGDINIDDRYMEIADHPLIFHWFAQNALLRHKKIQAIPIGLENRRLHSNGIVADFRKLEVQGYPKLNRILYGFTLGTNETERLPALEALKKAPCADGLPRMNSRKYREILSHYRFVASPAGNGIDCHRTWEAFYLRVIPIIKRSPYYNSFPNLPALEIDEWDEVIGMNEEFLDKKYAELLPIMDGLLKNKSSILWMDYWKGEIIKMRKMAQSFGDTI
jgi:hypothetical protein